VRPGDQFAPGSAESFDHRHFSIHTTGFAMSTRRLAALSLFVAGAAAASVFFASANRGLTPAARPDPTDQPLHFGWVDDPDAVRHCLVEMECGTFRETAAFAARQDGPEDVYLWESVRTVTGDLLPARNQKSVGSCVAFATASAIEFLSCVQLDIGGAATYHDLVQEVIYGGSRVEIGGGRIRGDGSIGAWAARWVKDYGVVPRGLHGRHDLRLYDENRCREYGRRGVPDDLEPLAKEHPVRSVANVRSWEECRAAILNGYPVLVCSSQGFTMDRDEDGFCNPRGRWYHAMAVVGVRGGTRPGGFLLNSWGPDAHRGPVHPAGAPRCGFWADADVLERMLAQGDSWAFSRFEGFPPS
jgi:hypothetical protein